MRDTTDIYYFSFIRFPSEKAHALYIVKACEAFAQLKSSKVTVIVSKRLRSEKSSYDEFYNVPKTFKVIKLSCVDLFPFPLFKSIAIYVGLITFAVSSVIYTFFKIKPDTVIFSNNAIVAWFLTFVHRKVIYELHDYPHGSLWLYKSLFRRVYLIQTNNHIKRELLETQFRVPKQKTYCAHNGVTLEDFTTDVSKAEARNLLHLPVEKNIVVYTGHLYDWKGADLLAEVAKYLPDVDFLFVGGNVSDIKSMKKRFGEMQNVHFLGYKPHQEMPLYQRAADILVVPNTAKKEISRLHTSPMKIFEYMASGTLIVASDIPSIREILNEHNSLLFTADSVTSLQLKIREALGLSLVEKERIIHKACADVGAYAWSKRANFIYEKLLI